MEADLPGRRGWDPAGSIVRERDGPCRAPRHRHDLKLASIVKAAVDNHARPARAAGGRRLDGNKIVNVGAATKHEITRNPVLLTFVKARRLELRRRGHAQRGDRAVGRTDCAADACSIDNESGHVELSR